MDPDSPLDPDSPWILDPGSSSTPVSCILYPGFTCPYIAYNCCYHCRYCHNQPSPPCYATVAATATEVLIWSSPYTYIDTATAATAPLDHSAPATAPATAPAP